MTQKEDKQNKTHNTKKNKKMSNWDITNLQDLNFYDTF
jgi:hypothetical protein